MDIRTHREVREIRTIEKRALSNNSDMVARAKNETKKANTRFIKRNLGCLAVYAYVNMFAAAVAGVRGTAVVSVIAAVQMGKNFAHKINELEEVYQNTHLLESQESGETILDGEL